MLEIVLHRRIDRFETLVVADGTQLKLFIPAIFGLVCGLAHELSMYKLTFDRGRAEIARRRLTFILCDIQLRRARGEVMLTAVVTQVKMD